MHTFKLYPSTQDNPVQPSLYICSVLIRISGVKGSILRKTTDKTAELSLYQGKPGNAKPWTQMKTLLTTFLWILIEEKVENLQIISPTVRFTWWRFSTALQLSVNTFHPKYLPRSNRIIGSFWLKESKKHQTSPGNSLDLHHHPVLSFMIKIRLLQNQRETGFTG